MMHLYSALLCIAVHRKGFAIMWGGGGGGSPQPPPVQLPLDHLVEMKESFDRLIKKKIDFTVLLGMIKPLSYYFLSIS